MPQPRGGERAAQAGVVVDVHDERGAAALARASSSTSSGTPGAAGRSGGPARRRRVARASLPCPAPRRRRARTGRTRRASPIAAITLARRGRSSALPATWTMTAPSRCAIAVRSHDRECGSALGGTTAHVPARHASSHGASSRSAATRAPGIVVPQRHRTPRRARARSMRHARRSRPGRRPGACSSRA